MRYRSRAKRAASSPPSPARISTMTFFSSSGSRGTSGERFLERRDRDLDHPRIGPPGGDALKEEARSDKDPHEGIPLVRRAKTQHLVRDRGDRKDEQQAHDEVRDRIHPRDEREDHDRDEDDE